jgi:iron(III) transport system ATP-binding protein
MALSDVVVVMNAGRIEQAGPPDDVYRHPATRFVADFIGRANFLPGTVTGTGDGVVEIESTGQSLRVPAAAGLTIGAAATIVVRPEALRMGVGELTARIGRRTFLGPLVEYELLIGDQVLLVVDPDWLTNGLHEAGDEVAWSVRAEQAYVLPVEASRAAVRDATSD